MENTENECNDILQVATETQPVSSTSQPQNNNSNVNSTGLKSSCAMIWSECCQCSTWLCCHRKSPTASPRQRRPCLRMPSSRLDSENLIILSLVQLLCGSASIVLFGVTLTKQGHLHEAGTGLWAGCIMLASGCMGLISSRYRRSSYFTNRMLCAQSRNMLSSSPESQSTIAANVLAATSVTVLSILVSLLVLCVLAIVASAVLTGLSIAGLIQDGIRRHNPSNNFPVDITGARPQQLKMQLIVLHTLLFIVGFLECCVALATCVICARQICFSTVYLSPATSPISTCAAAATEFCPRNNSSNNRALLRFNRFNQQQRFISTFNASEQASSFTTNNTSEANHRQNSRRQFLLSRYSRRLLESYRQHSMTQSGGTSTGLGDPLINLASVLPSRPHQSSSVVQPLASLIQQTAVGRGGNHNTTTNGNHNSSSYGNNSSNNNQLPVLTTNPFYANVLFHNGVLDPSTDINCRTSLVYLSTYEPSTDSSPHANPQESTQLIFPPFPPCYSPSEARPLSAYACVNNAADNNNPQSLLQPALLIQPDSSRPSLPPPPYDDNYSAHQSHVATIDNADDSVELLDAFNRPSIIPTNTSSISSYSSSASV